jgi:hypothetical protein
VVTPVDFLLSLGNYRVITSPELGFFLVRHNAISKQGINFEEHYFRLIVGSMVMWALEK